MYIQIPQKEIKGISIKAEKTKRKEKEVKLYMFFTFGMTRYICIEQIFKHEYNIDVT